MSLSDVWQQGGITLLSIGFLSLAATVVFIERLLVTQGVIDRVRTQADGLIKLLYQGDIEGAKRRVHSDTSPEARLFEAPLMRALNQRDGVQVSLERRRQEFNHWLRARLWMLGTIASTAPFIGLFGTVVGIMQSFKDIAETGGGGFAVVSRGLSEALITTAAGIVVAVEAVAFYNFLQARLGRIAFSVRLSADEFMEVLADRARWGGQ